MAFEYTSLSDTPEERQLKQRKKTFQRIRILFVALVFCVGARVFIKPVPPPKAPVRAKENFRYIPGMLDQLPKAALEKMDPQLLAQIRAAEAKEKQEFVYKTSGAMAGHYQPLDAPLANTTEEEMAKQLAYIYAKKRMGALKQIDVKENVDITKSFLIRFRSGGYLKAEKANLLYKACEIRYDRTLLATLPKQMVSSVTPDATLWKAPIPAGYVQLKPAKGITITVARETAKRITVPNLADES